MNLSVQTLAHIEAKKNVTLPGSSIFNLPEKVLQFGTGVLLRGLPDYFIDEANKKSVFNGRVVMVKSTTVNSTNDYEAQDNLFTHCIKGFDRGQEVNKYVVNASLSRILNAGEQWEEVLACASSKDMQIIISNTTEVGIILDETDDLTNNKAPKSFPGKLTSFLHTRYTAFKGASEAGMVILPTELITDNGTLLKSICLTLAQKNYKDPAFEQWLTEANDFCDTLVDRIVPGALPPHESKKVKEYLGFNDELIIMSEAYSLWAIQSNKASTKEILSFEQVNDGVIITENIEKFRNLKLRILNGAHTFSCGLALISGFETVKEAMNNSFFERFIQDLMLQEISKTLVSAAITEEEANKFSKAVMDRFRNPYIEHKWESISVNFSAKMSMRNIPTILEWYKRMNKVPKSMALGFAAYLYFLRSDINEHGHLYRNCYGKQIKIDDLWATRINEYWKQSTLEAAVHSILSDKELWNVDLTGLKDFEQNIIDNIRKLQTQTKRVTNMA
jgi:tagaturonate reductase